MIISNADLSKLVLESRIITSERLQEIVRYSSSADVQLFDALVDQNVIDDEKLGSLVAAHIKVPFVALSKLIIPDEVLRILPERVARHEKVIPFERANGIVKVAVASPFTSQEVVSLIGQKTASQVQIYFATDRDIFNALRSYRRDMQSAFDKLVTVKHGDKSIPVAEDYCFSSSC